jgi:putative transposase
MSRQARQRSESGIYHIIMRGINKQIIFEDDEDREKFIGYLQYYKNIASYTIYGYCLMDNHIHLLIKEGKEPIGHTMKRIGVSYVAWYNRKYDRIGHLFQDRFKSEVVETDKYLLTVLRYIHQNPVKAGKEKSVENYKWSSYAEYIDKSKIIETSFIRYFWGRTRKIHRSFSKVYE